MAKQKFAIGDVVSVISLEGNPSGIIYDITFFKKRTSYWIDLGKFGKMEFSHFELKNSNKQ